jgi:GNAT superfamily N-acetyltransferase
MNRPPTPEALPRGPYPIRLATAQDVEAMTELRREAERWLAARRIEQWTSKWQEVGAEKIVRATRQHRAWVVDIDGQVAATVTLGGPDEDLWHVGDGPGLYLYKLIVTRAAAGLGIGAAMLDWATDRAAAWRYPCLRLDIWPTNPALGEYYLAHGFRYVRTENVLGRDTGALYERPALPTTSRLLLDGPA